MKHIITLITAFLLPTLTFAYNLDFNYLDAKYLEEAKIIGDIVENMAVSEGETVPSETEHEQHNGINKRLFKKCKQVIEESKESIKFKRINKDSTSEVTVTGLFYNVELIKHNLPKEIYEEANLPTLKALAAYIVENNPEQNDFETLLAIGLTPHEAFELTKDYCDVQINQEANTITYDHFAKLPYGYLIKQITIPLN